MLGQLKVMIFWVKFSFLILGCSLDRIEIFQALTLILFFISHGGTLTGEDTTRCPSQNGGAYLLS